MSDFSLKLQGSGASTPALSPWHLSGHRWDWQRSYVMGILNLTPDSFSDGGEWSDLNRAIAQAQAMLAAGADILDLGGESTRPQATPVSEAEELRRVVPVVTAIRQFSSLPLSIDTTKAAVARAAVMAGASVVNDVSGATADPAMLTTVAELGVPLILMHRRGTPQTMQQMTDYTDLVSEVVVWLRQRIEAARAAGVQQIAVDPGFGFAKTADQSWQLLQRLEALQALGCPILVGTSRKSMLGQLLNQPNPKERVWGTAATCCGAIAKGANILRVHDVGPMVEVCRVADRIWRHSSQPI